MLTLKYNRSTQHIDGLTIRTTSTQTDEQANASGVVAYYAENACGAITRSGSRMAAGMSLESPGEALRSAEASALAAGRKMCKTCRAAAFAMMLDEAYAEQAGREQVAALAELVELVRTANPDVTDRFGRVWTWWKGSLYRHCGTAATKDMIGGFGLPSQSALDNPNYDPCAICLDGRDRHVTACRAEWRCSHTTCARLRLAEDIDAAYAEQAERDTAAQDATDRIAARCAELAL